MVGQFISYIPFRIEPALPPATSFLHRFRSDHRLRITSIWSSSSTSSPWGVDSGVTSSPSKSRAKSWPAGSSSLSFLKTFSNLSVMESRIACLSLPLGMTTLILIFSPAFPAPSSATAAVGARNPGETTRSSPSPSPTTTGALAWNSLLLRSSSSCRSRAAVFFSRRTIPWTLSSFSPLSAATVAAFFVNTLCILVFCNFSCEQTCFAFFLFFDPTGFL
mmetsp:Transcript_7486/g.27129  ORF Transcript_7486/g.27129 Transcript_7486/m.27129 type:complete len:219 (-) Transcript_7486:164-820(-)